MQCYVTKLPQVNYMKIVKTLLDKVTVDLDKDTLVVLHGMTLQHYMGEVHHVKIISYFYHVTLVGGCAQKYILKQKYFCAYTQSFT